MASFFATIFLILTSDNFLRTFRIAFISGRVDGPELVITGIDFVRLSCGIEVDSLRLDI